MVPASPVLTLAVPASPVLTLAVPASPRPTRQVPAWPGPEWPGPTWPGMTRLVQTRLVLVLTGPGRARMLARLALDRLRLNRAGVARLALVRLALDGRVLVRLMTTCPTGPGRVSPGAGPGRKRIRTPGQALRGHGP